MTENAKTAKSKKTGTDIVDVVREQTAQAAALAGIDGQERLGDARTNPAVRGRADELRDVQQRTALDAEHARVLRRHRVADRRAADAEEALAALALARQTSSPARSVLALHRGKRRFLRVSLAASVVLAVGSARGVEAAARALDAPAGTGYFAEVGLTVLSTIAIAVRAHLTEHGRTPTQWRNNALWALMAVPLLVSVAANGYKAGAIGVACSLGAVAFAVLGCIVAEESNAGMRAKARQVTGTDEAELHAAAMGEADPSPWSSPSSSPSSPGPVAGGSRPLTEAELVALGADAERVRTYLAGRGVDVEVAAISPILAAEVPPRPQEPGAEAVQDAARRAVAEALSQVLAARNGRGGDQFAAEADHGIRQLAAFLDRPGDAQSGGVDTSLARGGHIERQIGEHIGSDQPQPPSAGDPGDAPDGGSEGEGTDRVAAAAQARRDAGLWRRYEVAALLHKLPHTTNATLAETLGVHQKTIQRHRAALRDQRWDHMSTEQRAAYLAELRQQAEATR